MKNKILEQISPGGLAIYKSLAVSGRTILTSRIEVIEKKGIPS